MLTIVASTYLGHTPAQLRSFIGSLQAQTRKDFKVVINVDGSLTQKTEQELEHFGANQYKDYHWVKKLDGIIDGDTRFIVKHREHKGGCGNFWRSHSLHNDVESKMVHWTNADNQYTPVFVEYMLGEYERTKSDIIICQCLHNYAGGPSRTEAYRVLDAQPMMNWIDYVNFICKTSIAKKVSFNHGEFTGSDGMLVSEMVSWEAATVSKVHRVLSVHN